jgi:hypothetical protein
MEVSVENKEEDYDMCETLPPPPPPLPPPAPTTTRKFSEELIEYYQQLFGDEFLWKVKLLEYLDMNFIRTTTRNILQKGYSRGSYVSVRKLFKDTEGYDFCFYNDKPTPAFVKYAPQVLNEELGDAVTFSYEFNFSVLKGERKGEKLNE